MIARRFRRTAVVVAGLLVGLASLLLLLPGGGVWDNTGVGTRSGTPAAIVFSGIVFGLLNALVAAAIVLIYRSARIINFAQGAIGTIGTVFMFAMMRLNGWPLWLGIIAGLVVACGFGALVELGIIRRFFTASRVAVTVLTIALGALFVGAGNVLFALPIFPENSGPADLPGPLTLPFQAFSFRIAKFPLSFGFGHILAVVLTTLALVGLGAFLRLTRAGTAVRASAENAERAELLGINVRALSTLVWTIAAGLSGLALMLTTIANGVVVQSGIDFGAAALIPALAAALLGKLRSVPITVAAAVGISVATEAVRWSFPDQQAVIDVATFTVILVALGIRRRVLGRLSDEAGSWEASEEIRPTPRELLRVPGLRVSRWAIIVALVALVALVPWIGSVDATFLAGFTALNAIALLSIVVLTGWAGQVSLGQYAFVAVGAVLGGALTSSAGVSFWIAVPFASLATAAIAVLVGVPALRVKGLTLAIATFAFAYAVEGALFNESWFGWLLPQSIDRPTLLFFDFEDERSMYYLCVAVLIAAIAMVAAVRRGRTGRVLIAVRDNEANLESFGVRAVRAKLLAFGLSGFLCGLAGAMIAHQQREVVRASFTATESLDTFLVAVVGGIGSVWGAVLGTLYSLGLGLIDNQTMRFLAGPLGTLLILYLLPGGLASLAFAARDSVHRIVAHRRGLVIASLLSPTSGAAQDGRIPLVEPSQSGGLAMVEDPTRYAAASRLYGFGGLFAKRNGSRRSDREAAAIVAAAAAAEGDEQTGPASSASIEDGQP